MSRRGDCSAPPGIHTRSVTPEEPPLSSHLSIVSREINIPYIVSCRNATRLIKDGDRVRVDGDAGRVAVIN